MTKHASKRCIKNAIAIIVIAMMCGFMFFTMQYAGEHMDTAQNAQMSQGSGDSEPPAKPDESTDSSQAEEPPVKPDESSDSSQSDSSQGEEPPAKPDGTDDSQSSEPPAKPDESSDSSQSDSSQAEEPPAKPDENSSAQSSQDSDSNSSSQDSDSSSSSQGYDSTQSEKPSGEISAMGGSMGAQLDTIYYILFGAAGFVLAAAAMYLVMSRASKRSLRRTFRNKDKIIIYVLAIALITIGFIYGGGKATEAFFLSANGTEQAAGGGQSDSDVTYTAVKEITEDETIEDESYESTTADENVVLATGDITASLSGVTITKSGDSDGGDSSNFYGNNSGIIAKGGANLSLTGLKVSTTASGANGVFSYGGSATTDNSSGDGTEVSISDSEITTTGDNAGGIMTTGGGIMNASNLTITTSGISSAAIRSDRGGGTVNVDGGTYTTSGAGSPSIYSTASIAVKDAKLIAKASEGIVIEGKNSVSIDGCTLTDDNTTLNGQSTTYKNIFLYQSMSGDAAEGSAEFTATDSKITTKKGDSFYVTNTTAAITLENNTIKNSDSDGNFLRIQKDSWGNEGSNGGDVTLTMTKQKASGNIVVDSISTLDMAMKSGSSYTGTINGDNSAKSIKLTLDKKSKIKLTGDSYVSSLEDADTDYSNIDFNGYTLYVDGEAIN